ncbi:MAG: precorrin-3B C(17)-methyltransferase [Lachnospiraceae bacterium]|nr:precorrin-3B C(17)-methyltransferase [Lachnospiraceae bacterium]
MSEVAVIGLGPGYKEGMTFEAYEAIKAADVICGFTTYIKLLPEEFADKPVISTGMRGEVERCTKALEAAAEGKNVAMVCSGDSGLYGMAALVYELLPQYEDKGVTVRTVCGVTAALSGSARLGAAIGEDFATISLSNYLVTTEQIHQRLAALADCGMCMVFYNPRSHSRPYGLKDACDVLLKHLPADTACGAVKNIGREGEHTDVMTLAELRDYDADMFTAVFVGNAKTYIRNGKMITPRGYAHD